MSESRKAFEEWFFPLMYDCKLEDDMWLSWQASRAHALEEAIAVCMDMQRGWCSDDHVECATRIRSIK